MNLGAHAATLLRDGISLSKNLLAFHLSSNNLPPQVGFELEQLCKTKARKTVGGKTAKSLLSLEFEAKLTATPQAAGDEISS